MTLTFTSFLEGYWNETFLNSMTPWISVGFKPSDDMESINGFRSIMEKTLAAAAFEIPKASIKGEEAPMLILPIMTLKNTFIQKLMI